MQCNMLNVYYLLRKNECCNAKAAKRHTAEISMTAGTEHNTVECTMVTN